MKMEIKNKLDRLVKELSMNKKVMAIYLFGSRAAGRAREDSDIDIAVILKNPNEKDELKVRKNDGIFDVHAFSSLPLIIQFRVFREGKPLFIRDKVFIKDICLITIKKYHDFAPFFHRFCLGVIQNV